jgi:hypothetical protein
MAKKHELLGKETKVTFKHWKASGKTYRNNTTSGFKGSKWEGHHVVPGTSMEQSLETFLDGKTDNREGYQKALANFTNWDLNEEYNMLGLPTATTYRKAYRKSRPLSFNLNMPADLRDPMPITKQPTLPIHNPVDWGHTLFNKDVKLKLDKIWAKLNEKFKKHEPIEAADMKDEIQGISDAFRKKLQAKTGQKRQDWIDEKFAQFRMV